MSRVGKKPITIPGDVTVKMAGSEVTVSGKQGTLTWSYPFTATVVIDEAAKSITVDRKGNDKQSRANHGLTRALIANMIQGVTVGFSKRLLIYGTGYNCKLQGRTLHLNVGFSGRRRGLGSQFELPIPDGVEVVVEKDAARGDTDPASMVVKGADKQKVGQFAAEVRALRKTEPYKGKGIRYDDEIVRRKQGKALAGAGG